jgi:DNA-binding phage protein
MKRQQVSRLFAGSDPRISSFRRVAEAMGLSLGIFLEP